MIDVKSCLMFISELVAHLELNKVNLIPLREKSMISYN